MKLFFIIVFTVALALASDPVKPAAVPDTTETKLKALELDAKLTKLENLVLREQLAAQQLDKIRNDQRALYAETCKAAGLNPDPKLCAIDLEARTVTKREAPAK